jgi:hypothetical protein
MSVTFHFLLYHVTVPLCSWLFSNSGSKMVLGARPADTQATEIMAEGEGDTIYQGEYGQSLRLRIVNHLDLFALIYVGVR